MSLPQLPAPYSENFQANLQAILEQWRLGIENSAAKDHSHGEAGPVLSIVATSANLGVGSVYGESKITADTGFRYVWVAPGTWLNVDVAKAAPAILSGWIAGGIYGGAIATNAYPNQLVMGATSCLDSTGTIALSVTASSTTISIPAVASSVYDIYIVRLVSGGTCAFKTYLKGSSGPSGDATVNAWRWLGFWMTNTSGNVKSGRLVDDTLWFFKSSENIFQTKISPLAGISCPMDPSLLLTSQAGRVAEILLGGQAATADVTICVSADNANVHHSFIADTTNLADDDVNAWHSKDGAAPIFIPYSSALCWGDGTIASTGTADLRLRAVKLRR